MAMSAEECTDAFLANRGGVVPRRLPSSMQPRAGDALQFPPGTTDDEIALATAGVGADEVCEPRPCYVCRCESLTVHRFYHRMCAPCGALNYAKRSATADMDGRVAVVTGGRVKIGFQICLKLLRAGAAVVATTRFPGDALRRYLACDDFADWGDRLTICGLDLRDLPAVEAFADRMVTTHRRLHVLINNAASTIRRPPAFYAHLLDGEATEAVQALEVEAAGHLGSRGGDSEKPWIVSAFDPHNALSMARLSGANAQPGGSLGDVLPAAPEPPAAADGLPTCVRMTQAGAGAVANEDGGAYFPVGALDANGEQVDLRPTNSWMLRVGEVPARRATASGPVGMPTPTPKKNPWQSGEDSSENDGNGDANESSKEGEVGEGSPGGADGLPAAAGLRASCW